MSSEAVELLRAILDRLDRLVVAAETKHRPHRPVSVQRESALKHQGRAESAPQTLDPCFVALCEAEGSNPASLTAGGKTRIDYALSEIRKATKGVTAEEIRARTARYKARWPKWDLTAPSLATHWAKLAVFAAGPAQPKPIVPPEPASWAKRFAQNYATWQAMDGLPQRVTRELDGKWQVLRWEDLGAVKLRGIPQNFWQEFL